MEMRGDVEARLLIVERGLTAMGDDLRKLDVRSLAVWKGLWDAWADLRSLGTKPTPTPTLLTTSFSGMAESCTTLPQSGAAVTVRAHVDGTTWTGTTTALGTSNYSGTVGLSVPQTLDVTIVPASPRQATAMFSSGTITPGSSATISPVVLAPSTGYVCSTFCALPLKSTLTIHDTQFGEDITATFTASPANYGFPCWTGVSGSGHYFYVRTDGTLQFRATATGILDGAPVTSTTCPGDPPALSRSYRLGTPALGDATWFAGATFTLAEP